MSFGTGEGQHMSDAYLQPFVYFMVDIESARESLEIRADYDSVIAAVSCSGIYLSLIRSRCQTQLVVILD